MATTIKTANNIIDNSNSLKNIVIKSKHLIKLNRLLLESMPKNIGSHCKLANLNKGILNIHVDSANWATQLRYYIPELMTTLRKHEEFSNLVSIKHHVRPSVNAQKKKIAKVKPLSTESRVSLQKTADALNHPELAEALNRFASKPVKSDL